MFPKKKGGGLRVENSDPGDVLGRAVTEKLLRDKFPRPCTGNSNRRKMRPVPKTPTKVCRELGRPQWAVICITTQMWQDTMGTQIQLWEGQVRKTGSESLVTVSKRKQTLHGLPTIYLVPTSLLINFIPIYKLCVHFGCPLGTF